MSRRPRSFQTSRSCSARPSGPKPRTELSPCHPAVFGGQLEDEIETRFRDENYLVTPAINIEVLTYRPFYILGEVTRPGQYEYENGMTVINAVALAGGYTYRANAGRISIQRGDCVMTAAAESAVFPGEIVEVPERFF